MKIPTTVMPDFFVNPNEVREFGLDQNYSMDEPVFPGVRTEDMGAFAPDLKRFIVLKILSQFSDLDQIDASARVHFSKIKPSDIRGSDGIIHRDSALITSVIYLTPEVKDCGTSVFSQKTDLIPPFDIERKLNFYSGGEDKDFCDYVLGYNEEYYEEVCRANGTYNSIISFNGFEPHRANLVPLNENDDDERLTIVVFIRQVYGMFDYDYRSKVQF